MNKRKIEQCERLCRELLERAKAVKDNCKPIGNAEWFWGSRETGALRRTSLELTWALADLRRPR